jgi:hypothetical protein
MGVGDGHWEPEIHTFTGNIPEIYENNTLEKELEVKKKTCLKNYERVKNAEVTGINNYYLF